MREHVKSVCEEWSSDAKDYSEINHRDTKIDEIVKDPVTVFHSMAWEVISSNFSSLKNCEICVPSSGDNYAVFAFALMGAKVTSCDITPRQLENAKIVSDKLNLDIKYVCDDTMELGKLCDNSYDFVYTSNGVHVWIDDLSSMYSNINRILKPRGTYCMIEIHPFCRPFKDSTTEIEVAKRYDKTGPFGNTFGWRMQDIMNAIINSGLSITRVEEAFAEDYSFWSNWWSKDDILEEEKVRLMDYKQNPMAALPQWLIISAQS